MKKVVINTCYGGFSLSEEAYKFLNIPWDEYGYYFCESPNEGNRRAHPDLVRVVETLGAAANGPHADLKVVEIPDNVEYTIQDYDGIEWVAEKHRTWS